jgi:signal transduction histidine kinase/ligand-binding sensor domain-containing protein/CheY-like chemotaxis protein
LQNKKYVQFCPEKIIAERSPNILKNFFAALFLFIASEACQNAFASAHFTFESITTADGLIQNTVLSIIQDHSGFIWIGTADGLNRYDGKRFVSYTHKNSDSTSLSDNFVAELFEDHLGRIWIGTRSGLNVYDEKNNSFIHVPLKGFAKNIYSPVITEDRNGIIWAGTDGAGLQRIRVDESGSQITFHVSQFLHIGSDTNSIAGNTVLAIQTDLLNNLWIGTAAGLCRLNTEQLLKSPSSMHFERVRICQDKQSDFGKEWITEILNHGNQLWIGSRGRNIYCLDYTNPQHETWKIIPTNITPNLRGAETVITKMVFDSEENLWLTCGEDGLARMNFSRGSVTTDIFLHDKTKPNTLRSNMCLTIMKDRTNMLWIGTIDGISLLSPLKERFYAKIFPVLTQDTSDFNVQAFYLDQNRFYFFGTSGIGLFIFDNLLKKAARLSALASLDIYAIKKDDKGNFWIGTNSGVAYIEGSTLFRNEGKQLVVNSNCRAKFFKKNPEEPWSSIQSNLVFTLVQDHNDRMWIGTGQGLSSLDMNTEKVSHVILNPNNPSLFSERIIRNLLLDAENHLWIATDGGLFRYNLALNTFGKITGGSEFSNSLPSQRIVCLHTDFQNRLWVGTSGGGISMYDPSSGTFASLSEEDGLASNVVQSIQSDPSGNIWVSSNKGISRLDTRNKSFTNYDQKDGLASDEFNELASMITADGFIFFGTSNGYNSFHPDSIRSNTVIPQVALTDFKLHDKSLLNDNMEIRQQILSRRPITFSYNDNSFSFEFASLNFIGAEKNQYAVMLEGFDKTWVALGSRNFISYTNLDPGKYTLRIKASNNANVWNDAGISVPFIITPPFFRTWWFRFSIVLMVTLLIYVYYREHIRSIENRKEKELALQQTQLKEQFLANMSHEIRTPLNAIMGMTRLLYEKNPKPEQMKYLNAITQSSDHLLVLINDILDFSKIEAGKIELENIPFNIRDAINNVHTTLRFKAEEKGLIFSVLISPEVQKTVMGDPVRLAQVLINLAGNAIKFTSKGSVTITCSAEETGKEKSMLMIQVADTGVGIAAESIGKIFDSFTQENSSVNREFGGTGLGLAISKRLIEMQGGILSASSTKGEGSTFTVSVPYKVAEEAIEPAIVETVDPNVRIKMADLKILLVDDNHFNQLVAIDTLELELTRAQVDVAENGEEAIRLIAENNYDIVLMDVQMPVMNGLEATRAIRKLPSPKNQTRIIAMTASAMKTEVERCFAAGMDDFVAKPFNPVELLKKMSRLVQRLKVVA